MAETKTAKKPDYTNSAENLVNPEEVKALLDELHQHQGNLSSYEDELKTANEELVSKIELRKEAISDVMGRLKASIEEHGSYQDIEAGLFAVRYRRMIKAYHVNPFLQHYSKYAPAVVEQTINAKALDGLVKGGLIKVDDLKDAGVITETPQFAFYVR